MKTISSDEKVNIDVNCEHGGKQKLKQGNALPFKNGSL